MDYEIQFSMLPLSLHVLGLIEDVGEDTNQAKYIGHIIEQNVKKDFSIMHGKFIWMVFWSKVNTLVNYHLYLEHV